MSRSLRCAAVLCAVLASGVLAGCFAVVFAGGAAAGVSGAVWYRGEVRTSLAGSLPKVRDAARAVLEKSGAGVTVDEKDVLECSLESYTGDQKKVTVTLKSLSSTVTEIHVRVGFWGDEAVSRRILEEIGDRLGK